MALYKEKEIGSRWQSRRTWAYLLRESTKIATSCLTIIYRRTLETHQKKKIPHVQKQRRSHNKMVGGVQSKRSDLFSLSCTCSEEQSYGDRKSRWPSVSQEERPHQKTSPAGSWSGTSGCRTVGNKLRLLSHLAYGILLWHPK